MKKTLVVAGALCLVIGAGLLALLMTVNWGAGPVQSNLIGDIDRHFIEQMIPHHDDAVAMAELALDRAEHAELRELAQTIRTTQSQEIDQMRSWYEAWYGVGVPDDLLDRGSGMMGMGMGRMADSADLQVLEAAQPFDREFIEQMVPHHQMGVMMAQMVLSGSAREEIRSLARSIIRTQSDEIERMRDWYQDWYGG
jgi:uncharacterized protein (DUF305 family)